MGASLGERTGGQAGFSLVELMTVLLIIGVLVAVAIPLYVSVTARADQRTCFTNQNTLERVVQVYLGTDPSRAASDLAGVIDGNHPVVMENIVGRPPTCPAAPDPADPQDPSVAEGAYTYNTTGTVLPCTHGSLGPHGHF